MEKVIKQMTIGYSPNNKSLTDDSIPMLRIANKLLLQNGFKVGKKIMVEYQQEKLIITLSPLLTKIINN